MELTDAIRTYIEKRLKGLEKFISIPKGEPTVYVEVGKTSNRHKSGDIFKAEIKVSIKEKTLYAVSELSDLYSAIDEVRDEIIAEAKKVKAKKQVAVRKGGLKAKDLMKRSFKK